MDNSENIKLVPGNKVMYLDPNHGQGNVPIENLNISVDLFVMNRNRSFIGVMDGDETMKHIATLKDGSAPFFEGSDLGNGFSFTTDYTEVGDEDHSGRETLGITSIDIDFNSAYMPLVTMELVDIRGRMHEMGMNSPYNAFFGFPYPIFKLVVKGYYGKPVEYMLHLTRYNGKLDSGSGNYNITCNFTGYTYAYLSDMLLGYLKAVPYTTEGAKIVLDKKREDPSFLTFDELYEYAKVLNRDILSIKEDDEDVQKLVYGYKTLAEIKEIKEDFLNVLKISDYYKVISRTGDFLFVNPMPDKVKYLTDGLSKLQTKITELDDSGTLNPNLYRTTVTNFIQKVSRNEFIDEDGNILESYQGSSGSEILKNKEIFLKIAEAFQNVGVIGYAIHIFHFKEIIDDLNQGIDKINKALEDYKVTVANKFFDQIEELKVIDENGEVKTFDFNIYNYMKVLCDHVDILMGAIKTVSSKAESDSRRNSALISGSGEMDIYNVENVDKIYGFPDYKRKTSGSYTSESEDNLKSDIVEDYWIGNDYPDIIEVRFIKELYDGMVKNKVKEEDYKATLENQATQWYPVSPFDTPYYMKNNNPWFTLSNTNKVNDIVRLLTYRALIFLGINCRNASHDEIVAMAKLEANNAFINISNPIMRDIVTSLNSTDKTVVMDKVLKMIKVSTEENVVLAPGEEAIVSANLIEALGSDKYKYVGDYGTEGSNEDKRYLPLTPEVIKRVPSPEPEGGIDEVSVSEDNALYLSDYVGSEVNKPDDGALYFDILRPEEYVSTLPPSTYGSRITENLNKERVFSENYLKSYKTFTLKDVVFNGIWLVNDFIEYDSESNGRKPFYAYFYEDEDKDQAMFSGPKGSKGPRNDVGKTISGLFRGIDNDQPRSLPDINFYTSKITGLRSASAAKAYSVFGSEYYYHQNNDYGRALLFLHSIPFRGMQNDDSFVKKILSEFKPDTDLEHIENTLFNKEIIGLFDLKGSNVQVPYVWILLIGGLLFRKEDMEILSFIDDDGNCVLPLIEFEYDLPTREDFLKMNTFHERGHSYDYNPNRNVGVDAITRHYRMIDRRICNLPETIRKRFKDEFISWVNDGGFRSIADKLEIFKDTTSEQRRELYINLQFGNIIDSEDLRSSPLINGNVLDNYISFYKDVHDSSDLKSIGSKYSYDEVKAHYNGLVSKKGNPYNFSIELKDDSAAVNALLDLLNTPRIIVNGTWRIWDDVSSDITVKTTDIKTYVTSFFDEFEQVNITLQESGLKSFGMTNSSDIYLTIYKNIKSIKDKWVNNYSNTNGLPFRNLIDSFKFIDRGYNDIGKPFKLNPIHVASLLSDNHNTSLYAHTSKILSRNNFDFIAMPNFVDYTNSETMSSIFKTYSYSADVPTLEPAFVCMYIGERSNVLASNPHYLNDSFNITEDGVEVPNDFKKVPAFLVKYGDQNQSIFKDLELDQSEFSETNESLMVTDQIASSYNNINSVGQNLFNIYNNRAYNSKIEMLGNAMIQPFMYFQLENVPMFRGAYIIIKVQHKITANSMTTKFTGNRVKRPRTKLLDKVTIFNNLLGNFNDISISEGSLSNILTDGTSIGATDKVQTSGFGFTSWGNEDENSIQLTENFTLGDFQCKDNSKTPLEYRDSIQELANNLQILRDYLQLPIIITNGYRSDGKHAELLALWKKDPENYNQPAEDSQHRVGKAADIVVKGKTPREVEEAILYLTRIGQMKDGGIGHYNNFIHYDIRENPVRPVDAKWPEGWGARWPKSYWNENYKVV